MKIFMIVDANEDLNERSNLTATKQGILHAWDRHCWLNDGKLPLDNQERLSIAQMLPSDQVIIDALLERFYQLQPDGHYSSPSVDKLRQASLKRAETAAAKAKKAAESRWGKI